MRHRSIWRHAACAMCMVMAIALSSCGAARQVPLTGRKQHISYTDGDMLSLGTQYYKTYLTQSTVSTNQTNTAMVKRVGQRLASAVEIVLNQTGYADEVQYYQWEFNLLENSEINAFCMPGGKIAVYTGLLPVTQDEASLAIVLGHEIAHAVAKHSAEQMSKEQRQQMVQQLGAVAAQAAGVDATLANAALSMSTDVLSLVNLKYSRNHELEADRIGLVLAALAGYDPRVAVTFWQRMSTMTGGTGFSLLNTHPSDATRIKQIEELMPEALQYYQAATGTSTTTTSASQRSTTTTPAVVSNRFHY